MPANHTTMSNPKIMKGTKCVNVCQIAFASGEDVAIEVQSIFYVKCLMSNIVPVHDITNMNKKYAMVSGVNGILKSLE